MYLLNNVMHLNICHNFYFYQSVEKIIDGLKIYKFKNITLRVLHALWEVKAAPQAFENQEFPSILS